MVLHIGHFGEAVSRPEAQVAPLVWSYIALNVAAGTAAGALQILIPLFALRLSATTAEIGTIRGIAGLGMLLLVVPAGFLVDHFGARRLFLVASVVSAGLVLFLPFSTLPIHLIVLQGLAGLVGSLKGTALNASFFARVRELGLDKAGWFKGSMSVGLTFLGPLLAGWAAVALSLPAAFHLLAGLTLVPTALALAFHRDEPRSEGPGLLAGIAGQAREFAGLWRDNPLGIPLLTEVVSTACFACFAAFVVPMVVEGLHLPVGYASLLMTLEGGVFIATVFLAGRLVNRLRPSVLHLGASIAAAASLAGVGLSGSFVPLAIATGTMGVGLGLLNLVTATRQGTVQGSRGKVVALFTAAVGAGASLGPMLGGQVAAHVGIPTTFLFLVPVLLGLAVLGSTPGRRREASFLESASNPA
jgi:predicted MFS family arabinose efflux permease